MLQSSERIRADSSKRETIAPLIAHYHNESISRASGRPQAIGECSGAEKKGASGHWKRSGKLIRRIDEPGTVLSGIEFGSSLFGLVAALIVDS